MVGRWVWLISITEVSECHSKDIILQVGGREGFSVSVLQSYKIMKPLQSV